MEWCGVVGSSKGNDNGKQYTGKGKASTANPTKGTERNNSVTFADATNKPRVAVRKASASVLQAAGIQKKEASSSKKDWREKSSSISPQTADSNAKTR